uniref:FHF complex subunit HOOK-interacting protein C-terminal domain-containing protein n=1 Tax=Oryzias sinensis TaxID=183150 RepID=A0A8C7WMN6_9TELE
MNSVCVFVCVCGQVLATGLSGLYSSLPTRLQVYSEDWHCLDPADWQQVPALVHFLHSLDFCSAVTKVAHPSIRSQLLGYIYDGFLVPVLAPALHKLTVEEVMTTTAYLDLFLRSISEPALLQIFLSFILLHTHDNVYILDTLVSRVNTPFQLGTVSLALFRTLIGLFCEDVMLQLVFRYLIPCSHLSRRQRRSLKQRDCYSSSAASFLLLMPSWCPVYLHSTNARSEHIHWPKGADLSVSDSVGYCRASDFLMDVNYLHYLWDARHTIANAQRACRFWSAPYDGTDPPAQEFRPDTPGDDIEDEEELIHRIKSDSIFSLVITSPPSALSPTPSSLEAVSNRAGRASSALELEWDDIFAGQDLCLSPSPSLPNGSEAAESGRSKLSPTPPQVLPLHIQEMQRTATKLVHGSYVEESEFLDDVQVYDLVARKDAKSAVLERMRAANQKASGSSSKGLHVGSTTSTVLTTTGKTVMETVNSIMSTRRRSEDEGRDERRKSTDYEITTTSEGYRNDEANNELETILERVEPPPFTNSFNVENHIITKSGDCDEERLQLKQNSENTTRQMGPNQNTQSDLCLDTNSLPNGHCEPQTPHVSANPPGSKATKNSSFLSQYCELMHSLGVEPDCDDMDDHHETFQRRVQALRQKLKEEDEFSTDFLWEEAEEEGETMEEEEEKEEERSSSANGGRRHGVPCTGPFISVLLSRLENLLENSISVNLLLTGILVQLVSYPQPLLRSFLLSTELHSQPSVRTLHQVLVSVHAQIERYVEDRPDYPALVTQAWRFLLAKDQDCKFRECLESQGGFIVLDPSLPNGSLKKALPLPPLSVLPPCPSIPPHAKSRVFAIVLFAEFLKELAAFAQEQSIAPDWWEEFESRD